MGKIIAIGGGRYDDGEIYNVLSHIVSMSEAENPKVLFLPTAGFDDINGDEPIRDTFEGLGCSFDYLFLTDETLTEEMIREAILSCDIVYAGGGNLEFLMNTWKKTKADVILKEAYDKGIILSGYSSGAMCWFSMGYDDCAPGGEFMFVDCLGILDFCNCPHFQGGRWPSFADAVKTTSFSGIAVDNGAAIVYDNGEWYTLQGNDGGEVFLFDARDNFKKYNLSEDTSILKTF